MTLILKLDLDMVKIDLHMKNEVPSPMIQSYSLSRQTQRDTPTDRQTDLTEIIIYPHTRIVIKGIRNHTFMV